MKVVSISHYSSHYTYEEDLLKYYFTSIEWGTALKGVVEMISCFGFVRNAELEHKGLRINLVKDLRQSILQKINLPFYLKVLAIAKSESADILHFHNLGDPLSIWMLQILKPNKTRLIVQDHGSLPNWKTKLFSFVYKNIDSIIFNAHGQELSWIEQGIIKSNSKCSFILENSSSFSLISKVEARSITGMSGSPILLWVGNLTPLKDPFVVLESMIILKDSFPHIRLFMVYRLESLLTEVTKFIEDKNLSDHIFILGELSREELEPVYNSADFFISASHKEGSGYAAIEAMSCGAVPLLSDIPSFRLLTDNGKVGRLFPIGDKISLVKSLNELINSSIEQESEKTLSHFKSNLSFERIRTDYGHLCKNMLETIL